MWFDGELAFVVSYTCLIFPTGDLVWSGIHNHDWKSVAAQCLRSCCVQLVQKNDREVVNFNFLSPGRLEITRRSPPGVTTGRKASGGETIRAPAFAKNTE